MPPAPQRAPARVPWRPARRLRGPAGARGTWRSGSLQGRQLKGIRHCSMRARMGDGRPQRSAGTKPSAAPTTPQERLATHPRSRRSPPAWCRRAQSGWAPWRARLHRGRCCRGWQGAGRRRRWVHAGGGGSNCWYLCCCRIPASPVVDPDELGVLVLKVHLHGERACQHGQAAVSMRRTLLPAATPFAPPRLALRISKSSPFSIRATQERWA